ncbi:MAG TPA: hypothetical protein VNJ31_11860 [Methyloceanibacter sp.]|nr:hypothetical protein [Methyloceanibacter sp.]
MSGRGRAAARRGRRAETMRRETSRSVSEEITVLVNTLRELAAIRATAEDAAGRILDSAENLLAFADRDEAEKAQEAILAIMTACGFHDLVGQRVSKIAASLDRIIAARAQAAGIAAGETRARARRKSPLLEGPGLTGTSEEAQAHIDALFRDN